MFFVLIVNIALLISVFYISYLNLFGIKNAILAKKLHITAAVVLAYFMIIGIIGTAVSLPAPFVSSFWGLFLTFFLDCRFDRLGS